jgi:hypothetical protein
VPLSVPTLPRARKRPALALVSATVLTALAVSTTGCGIADDWSAPRASATVPGNLPASFIAPDALPSPAATITPQPDSWDGVAPASGYRVVLLEADYDRASAELAAGARSWAERSGASVESVRVPSADGEVAAIIEAMDLDADLIVSVSPTLVDALALVTASHLDEQFLLLGAQLPEPTENVTAAVWSGASTRGSEVANPAGSDEEPAYTAENADRAIAAGAAAVAHGLTGIVIDVR